jgi:hypothetical protein
MDIATENAQALRQYPLCQACNDQRSCAIERRDEVVTQVLCDYCACGGVKPVSEPSSTPGDFVPRELTCDPNRIRLLGERLLEARARNRLVFGRR